MGPQTLGLHTAAHGEWGMPTGHGATGLPEPWGDDALPRQKQGSEGSRHSPGDGDSRGQAEGW